MPRISIRISPDGKTQKVEALDFVGPGCAAAISPYVKGRTVLADEDKPEIHETNTQENQTELMEGT